MRARIPEKRSKQSEQAAQAEQGSGTKRDRPPTNPERRARAGVKSEATKVSSWELGHRASEPTCLMHRDWPSCQQAIVPTY